MLFLFEDFTLDVGRRELRRGTDPIPVEPQVFDLLVCLIENRDRVVSRDDLIASVWSGRVVSESTLASRINAARTAIGDSGEAQRLIKTIQRKGLRFVGEVRPDAISAPPTYGRPPAQDVTFCRTADGVHLAIATSGSGMPVVKAANWLNHIEYDWQSPIWSPFIGALSSRFRLIRYDERGNGLSDWNVDDISFDAFVRDLETVVDTLGLERFALLGISQGAAVSVAYATRHPERVSRLVLCGGYVLGHRKRADALEIAQREALEQLIRLGWGQDNPAFRQVFTSLFIPGGTHEQMQWFNKYGKQLFYLQNPEEFKKDSAQYVQDSLAIAQEIANVQELQEIWSGYDDMLSAEDTTGYYQDSVTVANILVTLLKDSLEYINRDTIFSKVRNPLPQDSLIVAQFDSMITNRTFDPMGQQKLEMKKRERENMTNQLVASLPDTLKFKNNPPKQSKLTEDSLKTLLSKNQLELGNLFLSEFNMPDSAYKYYYSNLTEYPNGPYYATSMFAMGSYYLTVENQKSADSLFNIIYDNYKDESVVNAAAAKLNKPFIDLNYDPAMEDYKKAEEYLLAEDYYAAIDKFKDIPNLYPKSSVAPKAIYASGWIEENKLNDYPAAVESYDTLISQYPASEYVRVIAPKVTLYKQEKRKLETAMIDSLNALAKLDSLASDTTIVLEETIPVTDTVQVAVTEEEQIPVEDKDQALFEAKKAPVIKEPVWNPRKRR